MLGTGPIAGHRVNHSAKAPVSGCLKMFKFFIYILQTLKFVLAERQNIQHFVYDSAFSRHDSK
jgi:hypothetical protein